MQITRRTLLGVGTGTVAALAAAGCGVGAAPSASTPGSLRATWWGGDSENGALNAALDRYTERTGLQVQRESLPWDGYWDKLATQTAARNAPDLIMQAGSQIPDYADRGALLDLSSLSDLDPSVVDEGLRSFGAVEDQLFGVVAAANATGLVSSDEVVEEAGITVPEQAWSWDELAELADEAHRGLGDDRWGVADAGGDLIAFILYVRDSGKEFYADDGTLNATPEELTAWLTLWHELRASGGAPPPDVTAEGAGSLPSSPLGQHRVAMGLAWTQDFVALAALDDRPRSISLPPHSTENPSLWMNAASLWSVSATSPSSAAAGELISYLLTDTEAITDLGVRLGMPPTQAARDQLAGSLDPAPQAAMDYMSLVATTSRPLNRLWPSGFAELRTLLSEINEAVAFESSSISAGVEQFFQAAESGE
ncbi:extracellular solute-binding protein [Auraticoccus sp. F435]|uniref:Extracellular solute-binding protein n=1 Tax=Auraticoccus cholistanensis TaxID=2656650 RepID=A0A6A9US20_9ACTN|nr:ABC transporter substrate-binding protein [Auraticoccus cholistanensis]MVA75491.1 extracellular solute-binding protein [Auraticoccus cholistanensis]